VALGLKSSSRRHVQKASEDSCFARTLGRRCGLETAVNGIPNLLTVRAFFAEILCDLFSSCSLPSRKTRFDHFPKAYDRKDFDHNSTTHKCLMRIDERRNRLGVQADDLSSLIVVNKMLEAERI